MSLVKSFKGFIAAALCLGIINLPVAASASGKMISTSSVVADLTHEQIRENVNAFMDRQEVQDQLTKLGVSPSEASQRLASLSDQELSQVAKQIENQKAGSDVIVIGLGTILIVVLIIFLIRRI